MFRKCTLALVSATGWCLAALPASGAVMVQNGSFESGGENQDVVDWFDHTTLNGDLQQDETSGSSPATPAGGFWLLLVDRVSPVVGTDVGVYQEIGTYDAGVISYDVSFLVGKRADLDFNEIEIALFTGSAVGADGTPISALGLTEVDTAAVSAPSGGATEAKTVSLSASGLSDGDTLWLSISDPTFDTAGTSDVRWGFIDDVSITAVIPEPASLALLSLGGALVLGRRRR